MKQYLFLTSALVVSGLLSGGAAEAACIQTPSCSSLGYTSSSSCNGGIKCPFGNAWNCTIIDKITEITNKITTIEEKITVIEENGGGGTTTPDYTNCTVGAILYSDKSCNANMVASKTPIGVVFDTTNHLAIALDTKDKLWSDEDFDVPGLSNKTSHSAVIADWQGKKNTQIVLEYCKANGYSCPAFEYVNSYKTEGTKEGDWYLPAVGELRAIYQNKDVLDTALEKIDGTRLGTSYYWSSSEYSNFYAWNLRFTVGGGGVYYDYYKDYGELSVRPVLAF